MSSVRVDNERISLILEPVSGNSGVRVDLGWRFWCKENGEGALKSFSWCRRWEVLACEGVWLGEAKVAWNSRGEFRNWRVKNIQENS